MASYDAVVIGAGPAGSAAAGRLAFGGRRVLVLEKERFPRRKVCGDYLSPAAVRELADMGVLEDIAGRAEHIAGGTVCAPQGADVAFRLASPGLGLSRAVLDERLARWARNRGAEMRFGARVREVAPVGTGFRVRLSEGERDSEIEARAVIGAWGRWDALDGKRVGDERHRRFLAWSREYEASADLAGQVRLYLFRGGYCGLSRIEGGRVHLAGLVDASLREKLGPGWDGVVAHARAENPMLDRALDRLTAAADYRGAGPVYLAAKPPVREGMLMIGDAAGVLDPFSGQGVACALASGLLAARVLEKRFRHSLASSRVPRFYAEVWRRRFGARFGWSAAFRLLVHRPRWAGGRLLRSALRRLDVDAEARASEA